MPSRSSRVNGYAVLCCAAALRVTRPARCGTVAVKAEREPFGPVSGAKVPHDFRQNRPTAGRGLLVSRTCAPFGVVPAASGRRSLPAGINTTGATPTKAGGVFTRVFTPLFTPPLPTDRASGQKGGVAPVHSLSAGAVWSCRSRTKNPNKDSEKWKGVCLHPPQCPRKHFAAPRTAPSTAPRITPERAETWGFPSITHPHRLGLVDPPPVQNRSRVRPSSRSCARADYDDVPRRKSSAESWPS